jgi:hypothetical protein
MKYLVEMGSDCMIYLPGYMKIGAGVQIMLRVSFRNLKGRNVDINDVGI